MTEAIETNPAPIETKIPFAAATNPAVARCVCAWIRVNKAERAKGKDKYDASKAADRAYLDAMPPLSGEENIRDFTACVTHVMIADIIMESSGAKYLYAAQVAHTTTCRQSGPQKPLPEPDPSPLDHGVQISLETLQIIFNPFGINACGKLFASQTSHIVRFGI